MVCAENENILMPCVVDRRTKCGTLRHVTTPTACKARQRLYRLLDEMAEAHGLEWWKLFAPR